MAREPIIEQRRESAAYVVRSNDGDVIYCRALGEARAMAGLIADNGARDVLVWRLHAS